MLALLLAATTPPALAGRPCAAQPLQTSAVTQGMGLAQRTATALDASGAQVLLLARAGQDLGKYGLRWSHLGFVYRDDSQTPAGQRDGEQTPAVWRVVHKLNHCGTANAALYRQGLGEFFLDNPHRYAAAFVVLSPSLQARLLPLLQDNTRLQQLDEPRYSMVAYPWSTQYQQSNQWALETLALAAAGMATSTAINTSTSPATSTATTRALAQAWLQMQRYQPTVLTLGPLTRLGARATSANVAFDDHPNDKRFSDHIETVTVDSVFAWLLRVGLGDAAVDVP